MNGKIRVSEGLNTSFRLMNASIGQFLLMGIILFAIGAMIALFHWIPFLGTLIGLGIEIVVFPPLYCGIIYAAFKAQEGKDAVEVGDMFRGFDFLGQAILINIIVFIFMIVAAVPGAFLFIPGIIIISTDGPIAAGVLLIVVGGLISGLAMLVVATIYIFAYPALVDKKCSFWEAMENSRQLVFKNFWGSLGTLLLAEIIEFVGVLLCCIGLIYATPLKYCFIASVYRTGVQVETKRVSTKSTYTRKEK